MVGKTDAEQEAAIDSPSFCALQPNCRKKTAEKKMVSGHIIILTKKSGTSIFANPAIIAYSKIAENMSTKIAVPARFSKRKLLKKRENIFCCSRRSIITAPYSKCTPTL